MGIASRGMAGRFGLIRLAAAPLARTWAGFCTNSTFAGAADFTDDLRDFARIFVLIVARVRAGGEALALRPRPPAPLATAFPARRASRYWRILVLDTSLCLAHTIP